MGILHVENIFLQIKNQGYSYGGTKHAAISRTAAARMETIKKQKKQNTNTSLNTVQKLIVVKAKDTL